MEGLARLLVLEKLTDTDIRYAFLESRRTLRGRPNPLGRYNRWNKKLKGDLKANETIAGLEANNYDVATLHIPYGPGWDARRIDKLVYQTVCLRFVSFASIFGDVRFLGFGNELYDEIFGVLFGSNLHSI